jgi:tRNA pseudouridine32 synthase/23S rRNA pseudouridine746 synthase/23S rRNA pseudouridine1911/1915/1917 synthase
MDIKDLPGKGAGAQQPRMKKKRQPRGLPILFEDKHILVVNKPSGLLTIGTDREKSRTAHYLLNDYVRKGNPKSRHRAYVVHRLDRDTSGVMLFAKSEEAKRFLQEHWEETEKHYLTIIHGRLTPAEDTISTYLVESSAHRVYSTPDAKRGKLSRTAYKVMKMAKGFSLVDVHLLTGRKHQIRVHFSDKGYPVAGDQKYSDKPMASRRLCLHARSLTFPHPAFGKPMTFEAEMPDDFVRLLGKI